MEMFLSAVLAELTTRSINFFISKSSKPSALDVEDRLRSVLLRAQVIVDEAMGPHITNRAMLLQVDMLRDAMHRGHYVLDTFRYQHHDKEEAKNQIVSHSSLLSRVNSAKDFCFSAGTSTQILEQLQKALDDLRSMILDLDELVVFLTSYPRLYRQPYSMHLLLGNCMFGRQMEAELVISFLLHTGPHGSEDLGVLPIVGPSKVGKSTLVAHVCKDERVRDHFSEIVFLSDCDFRDEKLATLREGCAKKYQNCTLNKDERMLVILEAAGDFNEVEWKRLCSASRRCMPSGSKIIITSRSDKITTLGTTQALTLKHLSHEAYWYFFKTLTFGSMDPEMHPRLTHLAMEIVRFLNGSLIGANIMACFLRDNFDIHFWRKVLAFLRGFVKGHVSKFGEHPIDVLIQNKPAHLGRMVRTSEEIMVVHQYERSSQEEVPKIMLHDVMYGGVKPHGKFEALAWRSHVRPTITISILVRFEI
ncbi:putative disease resistance protein RGA3 [Phragmites australis]|uniref:putative disease resistance protein RGA3 n=1 Tax=Phragmites australis TaxID=29695 RepID=UPI002D79EFC4|nr:putative disease resistance protein RGA3 [Phragmites australis]